MRSQSRVILAVSVAVGLGGVPRLASAELMPIQGVWKLDEKASKNVPDALKMVDLKITLNGKNLATQRQVDGANVGDALVLTLDGVPAEREIAKGQRGTLQGTWKAGGKLIEQIVKTKASNLLSVTQTTLITVSEDGKVMTRVQTTDTAGDRTDRVLIYRKRE